MNDRMFYHVYSRKHWHEFPAGDQMGAESACQLHAKASILSFKVDWHQWLRSARLNAWPTRIIRIVNRLIGSPWILVSRATPMIMMGRELCQYRYPMSPANRLEPLRRRVLRDIILWTSQIPVSRLPSSFAYLPAPAEGHSTGKNPPPGSLPPTHHKIGLSLRVFQHYQRSNPWLRKIPLHRISTTCETRRPDHV